MEADHGDVVGCGASFLVVIEAFEEGLDDFPGRKMAYVGKPGDGSLVPDILAH